MRAPRLSTTALTTLLAAGLAPAMTRAEPHPATSAAPLDEADEQYQLIVGLVDRGLHEVAVKEAKSFLARHGDHPKAPLARYRLATSLYELDRLEQARDEFASLAARRGFQFAAEAGFRLGQCELFLDRPAEAAEALERVLAQESDYLNEAASFFLAEARFRLDDFEAAERGYRTVIESGGEEYERDAAYGLIWCAFRQDRFEQAAARIEAFLRSHRDDDGGGELPFLLGESRLASGEAEAALAAYRDARGGAFDESTRRGEGFALAALGRHAEAARAFEDLLERHPGGAHRAEALLHRGIQLLRADRPEEALEALRDPGLDGDPEALYWRAQAELQAGDAEAALASIESALGRNVADLAPELRERLQVARGDALFDLGRGEEAVGAYSESTSEYALYAAAITALNEGRIPEAVKTARRVLEKHPETGYRAELQLVLAEGALAAEQYAEAEQAFLAALEAEGSQALAPRALSRAGWCRFLAGDPAGGAELFERVVSDHPVSPEAEEALFMLGRCREDAGLAEAAAHAWRRYVETYPEGPRRGETLMGLARVDPDGAPRWLEATLEEDGDGARSAFALFELAEADAEAGRQARAIERYRDLIERFPDDANVPAARYGLAWCLRDEGRHAEAAEVLEPFVQGVPGAGPEADALRLAALELALFARSEAGEVELTRAAYEVFRGACEDDARLWSAARRTVNALQEAGDLDGAQVVLDGLLGELTDPQLTLAVLVESSWLALERGRVDDAEAAALTGLKVAERRELDGAAMAEACFFVAEARYDEGAYARAAELYAEAAARGAADLAARAQYKRGFARLALEDWAGAEAAFAALAANHPDHELTGEGLYLLGEARVRANQLEAALEPLETLRRTWPDHASTPKALFRLAQTYGRLEQWQACEQALDELARRDPDFELGAEVDLWRGRALAARGDRRGARAAFDRVVARDKTVLAARARIGIGQLALEAGEPEDALAEFLKVALLFADPEEVAQALYLAGTALEQMDDTDRARAQYLELIESHPDTRAADLARQRLRQLGD